MYKTPIATRITSNLWKKMDNIIIMNQIKIKYYLESQNPSFMKPIKGMIGLTRDID